MCLKILLIVFLLLVLYFHYYLELATVISQRDIASTHTKTFKRIGFTVTDKRANIYIFHSVFSRDIPCHIKEKLSVAVMETANFKF